MKAKRLYLHKAAVLLLIVLCAASLSHGQGDTGRLQGTITDPSGGALTSATVEVTNTGTGRSVTSTTNALGYYSVSALPPGHYRIDAWVVGGWQLNGIYTLQSGLPFNVTVNGNANATRADLIGAPSANTSFNPGGNNGTNTPYLANPRPRHSTRPRQFEHRLGAFQELGSHRAPPPGGSCASVQPYQYTAFRQSKLSARPVGCAGLQPRDVEPTVRERRRRVQTTHRQP
jgi:hypothetical protein